MNGVPRSAVISTPSPAKPSFQKRSWRQKPGSRIEQVSGSSGRQPRLARSTSTNHSSSSAIAASVPAASDSAGGTPGTPT